PWQVLSGELECSRALVESVCRKHGADPIKNGWTAPRPGRKIHAFQATPELVHGVTVASPDLALLLRKAGWFSGKFSVPVDRPVIGRRDIHGVADAAEEVEAGETSQ